MTSLVIPTPDEYPDIIRTAEVWLQQCTCTKDRSIDDFFLAPGQVLAAELMDAARRCPTRLNEIVHAYLSEVTAGYVAGLSPAQRRQMTLEEALEFAARDSREHTHA